MTYIGDAISRLDKYHITFHIQALGSACAKCANASHMCSAHRTPTGHRAPIAIRPLRAPPLIDHIAKLLRPASWQALWHDTAVNMAAPDTVQMVANAASEKPMKMTHEDPMGMAACERRETHTVIR